MKRNILFIVIDCLRQDILEKNIDNLPNFKRLRDKSLVFANAFATCSTTTPSFASILTGQYSMNHGVRTHHGHRINPESKTLQEVLSENGYNTYAEVTGPLYVNVGINKGFKRYTHRSRVDTIFTKKGQEIINAIGRLDNLSFFFLHLWTLHIPRWILKKYNNQEFGDSPYERALKSLDDKLGEVLDAAAKEDIIILTADHGEGFRIHEGFMNVNKIKFGSDFERKILLLKSKLITLRGRILHKLGFRQTRRIIGHGYHVFDKLIHVPLYMHIPGMNPKEINVLCSHVDIMPTILDLLKIQERCNFDGKSLLGAVAGKEIHDAVYCEAVGCGFAKNVLVGVRTKKYKYCCQLNNDYEKLYDLDADPQEETNIAQKYPELAKQLKNKMLELSRERADDFSKGEKISVKEEKAIKKQLEALGYFD
ncbi:sulfatase-like hydrolase/transferase [Candidatus Woesearchaeota archaeon]|nr:sulfatase-like hydrolase/transferase [Candidatus Woesearchaeota archaeon]